MAKSKNKKNARTKSQPYTNKSVPKNVNRAVALDKTEEVTQQNAELETGASESNLDEKVEAVALENETADEVSQNATDIEVTETELASQVKAGKSKGKVTEVKAKDVVKSAEKSDKDKKKKNKNKNPNKLVRSLKNTGKELKQVTWPTFKQVVKQTGIVLAFVIVFAIVLFGFDRLCAWLVGLLY